MQIININSPESTHIEKKSSITSQVSLRARALTFSSACLWLVLRNWPLQRTGLRMMSIVSKLSETLSLADQGGEAGPRRDLLVEHPLKQKCDIILIKRKKDRRMKH